MQEFYYEGATSDISSQPLQYVTEVLEELGFNNSKVLVEVVGDTADNFSANVKRIVVVDDERKPFKMIAKFAPTQAHLRLGDITQLFRNEIIMYTEVLPLFKELEENANVPETQRLKFAKCYGGCKEPEHEVILLEDLNLSGFSILDKTKSLSNECVITILKNIAKLHSLSHALRNTDPKKFDEFKNTLFDIWQNLEIKRLCYLNFVKDQAMALLTDGKQKDTFKRVIISDINTATAEVIKKYKDSHFTVILQGDLWTNNIMFKFDSENLVECIMIDYQVARVNIPPADLMYLIFSCTDHSTRLKYFNTWIDCYHTELAKALQYYGLQISSIYPKDQLYLDLKNYSKVAFDKSLLLASVTSLSSDEGVKVKEFLEQSDNHSQTALIDEFRNSEYFGKFKEKLEGLIDSFVQFDLF
ncbi:hypothetical protein K1T71_011893 [Dendrolimus kikuchii]|uniref:Uncharacterized protein n=1 Tax=Dendrolimus kikuchii TaxID=765133 RepID=A0ACC1CMD6_9NEOP|nr:hypothetical protein K1T71_011893 [Dendrolimus kikuchii]